MNSHSQGYTLMTENYLETNSYSAQETDTVYNLEQSYTLLKEYRVENYHIQVLSLGQAPDTDEQNNADNHNNFLATLPIYTANLSIPDIFPATNTLKKEFMKYLRSNETKTDINNEKLKAWKLTDIFDNICLFISQYDNGKYYQYQKDIALHFWTYLVQIQKFAPMMIDPYVEEIYLLPKNQKILLDHMIFGRMQTPYSCGSIEIENFLRRIARDNIKDLTATNPSFRGDLTISPYINVRVTGDIFPYAVDGASANIRKLRSYPFTFIDLINDNVLSPAATAFIEYIASQGTNLTIVGSPSAGKTTFQTAILNSLPSFWRILSFEQTVEFVPLAERYSQLIRYKYPKYQGNSPGITTILQQVSQMLHRSPDYVNLGEVTTEEEATAWYQTLSAGIPSIQTMHAAGMHSIIARISDIFHVPETLLKASIPHYFIELKRFWNGTKKLRRVVTISELFINENKELDLQCVFLYNAKKDILEQVLSWNDLKIWKYLPIYPLDRHLQLLAQKINFYND